MKCLFYLYFSFLLLYSKMPVHFLCCMRCSYHPVKIEMIYYLLRRIVSQYLVKPSRNVEWRWYGRGEELFNDKMCMDSPTLSPLSVMNEIKNRSCSDKNTCAHGYNHNSLEHPKKINLIEIATQSFIQRTAECEQGYDWNSQILPSV